MKRLPALLAIVAATAFAAVPPPLLAQVCPQADAFEPNDTCLSAATLALPPPSGADGLLRFEELTLPVGDVDEFTIDVPPGRTYEVSVWTQSPAPTPTSNLLALSVVEHGNCSGTRLQSAIPVPDPVHPFPIFSSGRELPLFNRATTPRRFTVRVEQVSPANCVNYALRVDDHTTHYDVLLDSTAFPNLRHDSCAKAAPLPRNVGVHINVVTGRSTFFESEVSAGQTFSVAVNSLARGGVPLTISMFERASGCGGGAIPVATATYFPGATNTELRYENVAVTPVRVFTRVTPLAGTLAVSQQFLSFKARPVSQGTSPSCLGHSVLDSTCPCDNAAPSPRSQGCRNSTGTGARLDAIGSTDVRADDLFLTASDLPPSTLGVVIQRLDFLGPPTSVPFHDGQWCIAGSLGTLASFSADANGGWTSPTPLASQVGALPFVATNVQVWYRDSTGPCGTGSNTTNGLWVSWR